MAIMVEHFDAVSVLYHSGFLMDRGDAVSQDGLNPGNIGSLQHVSTAATAG